MYVIDRYGKYNEYSTKLLDTFDSFEFNEDQLFNNRIVEFDISNVYIKNKKTYYRIMSDLIYLEKRYREKYVRIIYTEDWSSYTKYNENYDKLHELYRGDLHLLRKKDEEFKSKVSMKFINKIRAINYYYFVYQMYADFKYWANNKTYLMQEEKYFQALIDGDTRYVDLIKKSFYQAYDSIILFNETNNNDFLNVNKMEKDIDLEMVDCIDVQLNNRFYCLNYLQPHKFKSKDKSIRIRRRGLDDSLAIQDRVIYQQTRKSKATRRCNSVMKNYFIEKEKNKKLTAKEFIKKKDISESTFYYYKKEYKDKDKEME